jgi:hypothetical protein
MNAPGKGTPATGDAAKHLNGDVDLLGRPLSLSELKILRAYRDLLSLLSDDLPPSVEANVREAAAAMWNAVTDLLLVDERPDL